MSEAALTVSVMPDLTDHEREVLAFERLWWKYAGARDSAIREQFRVSPWRHQQELNTLIDRPEALQHDPALVLRLRRLRDHRRQRRTVGL